jgi:hypothetical protein
MMLRRRRFPVLLGLLFGIFTFTLSHTHAQVIDTCRTDVEQALASIEDRCDGFSRNQACYVELALESRPG